MESDQINTRLLREPADVIARTLSIIFKSFACQGRFPLTGKHHAHLQEGWEGGSGDLQASQCNFMCWEVFGADPPQSHLQEPEGKEGDREQPVLDLQGQIMPDQPDCLQWWDDWLRAESAVLNVFLVVWMMTQNTPPKFLEKIESDFSHTCSVKGWEATDTNCSLFQYKSHWDNWQKNSDHLGTDTLPREAEEPWTLEIIKTHLNKARSNLL